MNTTIRNTLTPEQIDKLILSQEKSTKTYLRNYFYRNGFSELSVTEDAFQDARLRALKYAAKYDENQPFSAWFRKLAANVAVDTVKDNMKVRMKEVSYDASDNYYSSIAPSAVQFCNENSIVDYIHNNESVESVIELMNTLPDDLREVLYRKEVLGQKYDEISEAMGVPRKTLRVNVHRAKREMRKKIGS